MTKHRMICLGLLAVFAMAIQPIATHGYIITSGASTLFRDNFEGVASGAAPNNGALPGTWTDLDVVGANSIAVTNAVSPGPIEGTNYLRLFRNVADPSRVAADFSSTPVRRR
jgi:hypothetical protein